MSAAWTGAHPNGPLERRCCTFQGLRSLEPREAGWIDQDMMHMMWDGEVMQIMIKMDDDDHDDESNDDE